MIKHISSDVSGFYFGNYGSNCYLIKKGKKNIMIDTSSSGNKNAIINELKILGLDVSEIDIILLTHLHYDHVGNLDLFKNAKIYASLKEIEDFKKSPSWAVLGNHDELRKIKFLDASKLKLKDFKLIEVPGHTGGSIAFYMPEEKILFSGDTVFEEGIGRTDLPTSIPEKMEKSVEKLMNIKFKVLCAGH
jgi:glyoxylase-like metal-dependent hydrolase (beta-lactamase superfamily II)